MLKIRLKRNRRKKQPSYRLVIMPTNRRRDGRAIDELGFYNVITKQLSINNSKAIEWLKRGAKPTKTVRNLFKKTEIIKS